MKTRERKRWKPAGAITILDKDRLATLYLYTREGRPAVVGYRGRKTRPDLHLTGQTQTEIETTARRWLDGIRLRHRERIEWRKRRVTDEWDRNNVIRRIRDGLAKRGFRYSVTGGRGTAWGWIHIDLLPSEIKLVTPEKRSEAYRRLNEALGIEPRCFTSDGIGVPASTDYYREYVDRAEGRKPAKIGTPYWD